MSFLDNLLISRACTNKCKVYCTIFLSLLSNRLYLIKVRCVFISFVKEFPIFKRQGVAQALHSERRDYDLIYT